MLNEDCLNVRLGDYLSRRREPLSDIAAEAADNEDEVYRTRLSGHLVGLCGAPEVRVEPCGTCVERAAEAVLLDQPLGIVAGGEGADGVADLVDGLEDAAVDGLLLQGSEEPLDDTICLGLADEG